SRNTRRRFRSPYLPPLTSDAGEVATSGPSSGDGAARGFDRGLRALGGGDALQRNLARQLARQEDLGASRDLRDHAGSLQRKQVDLVARDALQIRQANLRGVGGGHRRETTLGQSALQRHLAAFETDLVETARARLLALVAPAG